MPGRYPCQQKAVTSGSGTRRSTPLSSNRHSSTLVATSEKTEKLVPRPSQWAPSGKRVPGHTSIAGPSFVAVEVAGISVSAVGKGTSPKRRSTVDARSVEAADVEWFAPVVGEDRPHELVEPAAVGAERLAQDA